MKKDVEREGIWFVVDPPGSCCCFIGDKTEIPYPPTHKWRLSSCCWGSRAYNSCFCQTRVRTLLHSTHTCFCCCCFYSNTHWLKTADTSWVMNLWEISGRRLHRYSLQYAGWLCYSSLWWWWCWQHWRWWRNRWKRSRSRGAVTVAILLSCHCPPPLCSSSVTINKMSQCLLSHNGIVTSTCKLYINKLLPI